MRKLLTGWLCTCFLFLLFSCQKEESLEFGAAAEGSLQSDAGTCLPKTVGGTYQPGKALNDSNFIEVSIDVTRPGRYVIATDTLNGYSFRANGVFTTAGPASVVLKGSGRPVAAGLDVFIIRFDSTECEVAITVGGSGGGPPTAGEYFPLTQNSWWSYDDGAGSDSVKVTVSGTATFSGRTYQRFIRNDDMGPLDTAFYRKDAGTGFYYESLNTADFSTLATFSQPRIDVLFLKSNLAANDTWNSDHQAVVSGVPATIRLRSTVVATNLTVTVNGIRFSNVVRIRQELQVVVGPTATPVEAFEAYYAKGIGRIRYEDFFDEYHIRNWQVN